MDGCPELLMLHLPFVPSFVGGCSSWRLRQSVTREEMRQKDREIEELRAQLSAVRMMSLFGSTVAGTSSAAAREGGWRGAAASGPSVPSPSCQVLLAPKGNLLTFVAPLLLHLFHPAPAPAPVPSSSATPPPLPPPRHACPSCCSSPPPSFLFFILLPAPLPPERPF